MRCIFCSACRNFTDFNPRSFKEKRMKKLFAVCAILASLTSLHAFADDDPLAKLTCIVTDTAAFCGPNDPDKDPGGNDPSCYKKVAKAGCDIITGSTADCEWSSIYSRLTSQTSETLCHYQKFYCQLHGYSDCDNIYNNCLSYNNTFKTNCIHKLKHYG